MVEFFSHVFHFVAGLKWESGFVLVMGVYVLLQVAYTLGLKQAAVLDVILLGLGFVLRAVAGAVTIGVSQLLSILLHRTGEWV